MVSAGSSQIVAQEFLLDEERSDYHFFLPSIGQ
jgi:hypothetical protein